ncbi:MAG: ATP-binding protein, partial [Marinilabiliaceae bacterium]
MRFLNKVVFINSAAIQYAEISINGNTHFTGTQGVGKSTVLRAILYFYNSDARKLGVPTGPANRSFADWYFPYANSYIVYEVVRETGSYCIMAFRSQNRVAFRFLDTAYDRKYFIDDHNVAYDTWEAIRSRLDADRCHYSRKVNSYDEYRDIIYGNNTGKKEFRKYALMESQQYKNIPRTIQNVFLNSKLEADFIKQTIIWSMNDTDVSIDLDRYAEHLKEFETRLNDIKKFRYPSVRKYADTAARRYIAIQQLHSDMERAAGQLAFRIEDIQNRKPDLLDKKEADLAKRKSIVEKRQYEKQLFEKRRERINGTRSRLKGKIREAEEKEAHYQMININEIIGRVNKRKDLEIQQKDLLNEQSILNSAFSEVTRKYEALIREQENTLNQFINNKNKEKNKARDEEYNRKEAISNEYERLKNEITQQHEEKLNRLTDALQQDREEIQNLEKKKIKLRYKVLYGEEIQTLSDKTANGEQELTKDKNNLEHYRQQIEILQRKWEYEKQSAEAENIRQQEKLQNRAEELKSFITDLTRKIETEKSSFIGWLNENLQGWQENIGKVVDENILYNQHLSPKITGNENKLYGVSINLDEIDREVKTTEDLRFEREKLKTEQQENSKQQNDLTAKLEKELQNIQRRNQPKIREYKDLVRKTEYTLEQTRLKIKQWQVDAETLKNKAEQEKNQLLQETDKAIAGAVEKEAKTKHELDGVKGQVKRQIDAKERERKKKVEAVASETRERIAEMDVALQQFKDETTIRIKQINKQKNSELDQKGADTKRLDEIARQLTLTDEELKYIDEMRDKVAEYNKDKRELFDRKKEFKNHLAIEDENLNKLTESFNVEDEKFGKQLQAQQAIINETEELLRNIENDLMKFEQFKLSETFQYIESAFESGNGEAETMETAISLIDNITALYYQQINRRDELKESIDKFLSHFSSQNIFNFSVNLLTTEDYYNSAQQLIEFIEENKIDEYEKRTNERFASIITTIGKETSDLISRTGEIQKIVTKINKDFTEKNFVGAVKKIELRVNDSKNSIVVLLKMIKEFNDNAAMDFGETNLFSSSDKDKNNEKAINLLKQLVKEISLAKTDQIHLADSFELTFRVEENQNDTG